MMDDEEIVEDTLVVDIRDLVTMLRRSGHIIVPATWATEIAAARQALRFISRKASYDEIIDHVDAAKRIGGWMLHTPDITSGVDAADRLLNAVLSDDFVCGFDIREEFEDAGEGDGEVASDGLPRPKRYGERWCQNIVRASWDGETGDMGEVLSSYPVFNGVEKECPESHGWNDDTGHYHEFCTRWMERLRIRRALMGRSPTSWQLTRPSPHGEPPPSDDQPVVASAEQQTTLR